VSESSEADSSGLWPSCEGRHDCPQAPGWKRPGLLLALAGWRTCGQLPVANGPSSSQSWGQRIYTWKQYHNSHMFRCADPLSHQRELKRLEDHQPEDQGYATTANHREEPG
jgi:hypothetical protein